MGGWTRYGGEGGGGEPLHGLDQTKNAGKGNLRSSDVKVSIILPFGSKTAKLIEYRLIRLIHFQKDHLIMKIVYFLNIIFMLKSCP